MKISKRILALILCLSLMVVFAACGGGASDADAAYVEWSETGLDILDNAAADYQAKAPTATTLEDSIQYAEEYKAILIEEQDKLNKIDANDLNEANQETFSQQVTQIEEGIASMNAGIDQMQAQLNGNTAQ